MVNIKDSNLKNSPIIVNSPEAKIDNSNRKLVKPPKDKKNILSNPWIITIIGGIIVGLILFYVIGKINMRKNEPKVKMEDSKLDRSPVIVDSPNANVDNSIKVDKIEIDNSVNIEKVEIDNSVKVDTLNINKILPQLEIETGNFEDLEVQNGDYKFKIEIKYIISAILGMKHNIEYVSVIIYEGQQEIGTFRVEESSLFNFMRGERTRTLDGGTKIQLHDPKIKLRMSVDGEMVETPIYNLIHQ